MLGGDLLGVADVGLAHLHEAPTARQEPQRGIDELTGQRVEDDVDALAAR